MQYGTYQGNLLISCVWLCLLQFAIHNWTRQTDGQTDGQTIRQSLSVFSIFCYIYDNILHITQTHTQESTARQGWMVNISKWHRSSSQPMFQTICLSTHTDAEHHVLPPLNNNSNNSNWLWNFLSAYTKNTIVIIIIVLGIGKAIMHIRHINMTKAKTWILLGVGVVMDLLGTVAWTW